MLQRFRILVLLAFALLLIATLAACGDDDKDNKNDNADVDSSDNASEVSVPDDSESTTQILSVEHITITDAWVRATVAGAESDAESGMESGDSGLVTGAFMIIGNTGENNDTLTGVLVDSDIASTVEIHETTIGENDVMQMRPVDGIDIPAGGNAVLKPGSYHIMLLDVQHDLEVGQVVPLTLVFKSGVTVTVDAPVRELG